MSKMTKSEKKAMQLARKRLREKGLLPLPKKRINRVKFKDEVYAMFEAEPISQYEMGDALRELIPPKEIKHITDEEMTALKVVKLALLKREFLRRKKAEGCDTYKLEEYMREVYFKVFPLPEFTKQKEEGQNRRYSDTSSRKSK